MSAGDPPEPPAQGDPAPPSPEPAASPPTEPPPPPAEVPDAQALQPAALEPAASRTADIPPDERPTEVRSIPQAAPPWWARPPVGAPTEPWSHLARALGYEVWVVFLSAAAIAVLAFVVFQGRFLDLYIKLRPHAPVSDEVALLTIGSEALYLWDPAHPRPEVTPRGLLAEMVRFLDAAGASVIVVDILLDTPGEGDDLLAAAAQAHGRVVAAERLEVTEPASGHQFVAGVNPTLVGAVHGGFANFQVEQDTLFSNALLVRRVPLVSLADRSHLAGLWPANQIGGQQDVDQVVPALSLLAATLHRRAADDPDRILRELQAGCSGDPLACTLGTQDLGLPAVPQRLTEPLPINFRGPEHADGIPVVDAARALRVDAQAALMTSMGIETAIEVPDDLRAVLEGRVVVVGRVDAFAHDRFTTPYSLPVPIEADMAGPRIHAHVIDTLLTGRHVREVGGPPLWGVAAVLALGVGIARRRLRDDVLTVACLTSAVALFLFGVTVFDRTDGVAIDLGPPLLGLLGALVLHLLRAWTLREVRSG